jgi:AcrR family transcriptional regulator
LEQAFVELLEEKGFQSVTVQDITDRATVNRATFYAHFEDKYALFDHIVRETFQQTLQSNLPPSAEFSLINLRHLILAVHDYLARLNTSCSGSDRQIKPLILAQVQAQLYKFILDWVRPLQPGAATPEITASVMSWAIFGAGLQWSGPEGGTTHTLEETANQVSSLIAGVLPGSVQVGEVRTAN